MKRLLAVILSVMLLPAIPAAAEEEPAADAAVLLENVRGTYTRNGDWNKDSYLKKMTSQCYNDGARRGYYVPCQPR